ncbi:MAG: response regulator, partial [Abditibacteriales bacterium]|nr:response regulator [Abditibacteriales bacterium]MDW8364557.1 response regulator [Abditibacteriales bacterium]
MSQPLHILLVDDNPADRVLVLRELRQAFPEVSVEQVTNAEQLTHALATGGFDVVITDYHLSWTDGLTVLRAVKVKFPFCPVVMFTATGSEEVAVTAMKSELDDYVLKQHLSRLPVAVEESLKKTQLRRDYENALQQLKASEERYRAIAEVVSDYAYGFRVEEDGSLVTEWTTDALIRALGYTPEEIARLDSWLDVIHPDDLPLIVPLTQRLMAGQSQTGELRVLTRDGETRWLHYYVRPVWDETSGRVVRLYGAAQDITERKAAEDALHQQFMRISLLNQITRAIVERHDLESIFRIVLTRLEDHLPIDFGGVMLFNAASQTFRIVARGPKSQRLAATLKVPEGTVFALDETPLAPCVRGEMVYLPDLTKTDVMPLRCYAHAGLRSVVGVPLMAEGQLVGVLGVMRRAVDGFSGAEREFLSALGEHVALAARQAQLRTDLQRAYDDLRQTQQAIMQQERLRAVGEMASGIAHDINNALSPIIGYTELLLMENRGLSGDARRYLETIRVAAMDIANTVARLREFYRQRTQQEALFPVDLSYIVRQVAELTRPRWKDIPQQRGVVIDVHIECDETAPPVLGIENEIREALTNLIFNAVDAMPNGGEIVLRTRVEEIGKWGNWDIGRSKTDSISPFPNFPTSSQVVLEVSDTGVGMDEDTRRRCLEPFFSTKGERGTGLGLAIVFGIMQRHGGRVEVESALGKGTTVRLVFPPRDGVETDVFPTHDHVPPLPPLRILCVDDEPLLREVLKRMLEGDGHAVEVADGGQAGIRAFRAAQDRGEPFDVVMTDLGMPYVDGREVARMVKEVSSHTPVLLLTGWGA